MPIHPDSKDFGYVDQPNGSIIHAHMGGHISLAIAQSMMKITREYADELIRQNKTPQLLLDMRKVKGQDSEARSAAKDLRTMGLGRIAVYGGNNLQRIVAQYIARSGGMGAYARFFDNESHATNWLQQPMVSQLKPKPKLFVRSYFFGALTILFLLILIILSFNASRNRNLDATNASRNQELQAAINQTKQRLGAYSDTLYNFRAFLYSSSNMNRATFAKYFSTLQLSERYPGFSAITYAQVVKDENRQAFVQAQRNDRSLATQILLNYDITPSGKRSEYTPIVYLGQGSTSYSGGGFDLAFNPVLSKLIIQSRDSGKLSASGLVNLNVANPALTTVRNGFLITAPLYTTQTTPIQLEDRKNAASGYVNVSLAYQELFDSVFENSKYNGLAISVKDKSLNQVVYARGEKSAGDYTSMEDLTQFGRTWSIEVSAPPSFGLNQGDTDQPRTILAAGIAIIFLLFVLYYSIARSRSNALKLASAITEDLQHEQDIAHAVQQKDEAILNSIGDAVFAVDTYENITLFNPSAELISGYSADEVLGRPYREVLKFKYEATNEENDSFIRTAMSGEIASMDNHTVLEQKNGTLVSVADSAAPILNKNNKITGVIVVFRDVTKDYELDKAKTEFVSLASHQLRTPLSAINWYAELLLDGDAGELVPQQKDYINEIHSGNQRMIDLVNSLLDVSRLDLGKIANNPVPTDLSQITKDLERELHPQIEGKHLVFKTKYAQTLPNVEADPKLLRMIIQNLMSNAVKYTPEQGEVSVDIAHKVLNDESCVTFRVKDSGYGIPIKQQNKVFSKLFRADNIQSLDVEGTGLGLYIVKQITDQLNGSITFKSNEGTGTTFTLTLPVKAAIDPKS